MLFSKADFYLIGNIYGRDGDTRFELVEEFRVNIVIELSPGFGERLLRGWYRIYSIAESNFPNQNIFLRSRL